MASEPYTPSTDEVREFWATRQTFEHDWTIETARAVFDRWLNGPALGDRVPTVDQARIAADVKLTERMTGRSPGDANGRDGLASELIDAGWDNGPHLSTEEAREWADAILESGWLAAHDAEVRAEAEEKLPPCDGGCGYGDGPAEDCSRHGRPVSEVWAMLRDSEAKRAEAKRGNIKALNAAVARAEAAEAGCDVLQAELEKGFDRRLADVKADIWDEAERAIYEWVEDESRPASTQPANPYRRG